MLLTDLGDSIALGKEQQWKTCSGLILHKVIYIYINNRKSIKVF